LEFGVFLGYLTLCIVWGTTYLAIKIGLEGFSPYYMAGVRFALGGLLLLPALFLKRSRLPKSRREWFYLVLAGILMLVGGNGFVTYSEVYLDSGLTALTVATNPAWAALIGGYFFSRDERYGKYAILGTLLSMTGVYVLHHDRLNLEHAELPGVIAALLAPLMWAIGSLIARKHVTQTDPLSATVLQMLTSSLIFFPISLAIGESWEVHLTSRVVWAMLFLIVCGSAIVYAVYVWLLRKLPASRVTTYTYINPIVALILGYFILGEPISPEIIPATALILGGLAFMYFMRKKKALPR
jgi:drug/metabolite transporter (DMT)-like permease